MVVIKIKSEVFWQNPHICCQIEIWRISIYFNLTCYIFGLYVLILSLRMPLNTKLSFSICIFLQLLDSVNTFDASLKVWFLNRGLVNTTFINGNPLVVITDVYKISVKYVIMSPCTPQSTFMSSQQHRLISPDKL